MPGSVLHINSEVALSIGSRNECMVAEVLISHTGFIQCHLQIVSCDCNITTSAYIVVIGAKKNAANRGPFITCNVSWLPVADYLPS